MEIPILIRKQLGQLVTATSELLHFFAARGKLARLTELAKQVADPLLWQNSLVGQKITQEHAALVKQQALLLAQQTAAQELLILAGLAWQEEDTEAQADVQQRADLLQQKLAWLRFEQRFDGEQDSKDCSLEIHAGAGGTESQDWVTMLLRLYSRWAEKHGFTTEILSSIYGETAGLKSVLLRIVGPFAYGWLKGEEGVHRLVRISPFDAEKRRHTSFASVAVYPVLEQAAVEIKPGELKIDTYRASGAGGQHVNKTDSAVRITHLPSGTVVQCQNNRSQHQNKAAALELLNEKLWKTEQLKQAAAKKQSHSQKDAIGWGYQIRSYVLQPYQLVKDLRSGVETSNVTAVLDGEIDSFLLAYLDRQEEAK